MSPGAAIYIGTSGFSYPEWKGIFYPDDLSSKEYLRFYARHFTTTEINNTFYRSPSESTASGWCESVSEDFRFALKLNQKITHKKRLRGVEEEMTWFLKGAHALGSRLGTVLVQLPPYFRKDTAVFSDFVEQYSGSARLAFEFRHDSWFSEDILELLRRHEASLAVVESDERKAVREITAPFVYVRLRKSAYGEQEMEQWSSWIRSLQGEIFVYLKHDQEAPALARQLQSLTGPGK